MGRKGRIVSQHHHFVVVCKLPNQSHPLHKAIAISNNRRYYDFPTAREFFCCVPTCSNPKGLTQLSKMAMVQSCLTLPKFEMLKTVAISHFRGCIFIHEHNFPTSPLNPWFYPSSAMYWYVGALGAWIIRLLRRYLHKFCHNCKYIRQNHTSN